MLKIKLNAILLRFLCEKLIFDAAKCCLFFRINILAVIISILTHLSNAVLTIAHIY